jgi:hypothetical protein
MFSLILAVLTIGLFSAMALVAVSYTPSWVVRAQSNPDLIATGLGRLERAYELASAAGVSAIAPTAAVDGGLAANFQQFYGFLPASPRGLSWSYAKQNNVGAFKDRDYFCLSGARVEFGEAEALKLLASTWGEGQAILANSCGDGSTGAAPASYPAPLALTYYVQQVQESP